ncbi:glycogen/starch synthase [Pseudomaricurvus hydrocarbonicus]
MVAAENGALPGGKVGGIGDVIRDIPQALAKQGHEVDVVIPGYQRFSHMPEAIRVGSVDVTFGGVSEHVELFHIARHPVHNNLRCWVLDHPLFSPCEPGRIYCDDPADSPFARDASKFALFCAAVAQGLKEQLWGDLDVVHLHDWHTALVALLLRCHPEFRAQAKTRLVYTIHNLSLQGIRPQAGHDSSLQSWFPELTAGTLEGFAVQDPRYGDCINPMRIGINLCDKVQAVSPTYAREIQAPSNSQYGFVGGEGLEDDLRSAAASHRLVGILNGCDYPSTAAAPTQLEALTALIDQQLQQWLVQTPFVDSGYFMALRRLDQWRNSWLTQPPDMVVTSVGRLTDQKVSLLFGRKDGRYILEYLLEQLHGFGVLVVLGSGDPVHEQQMTEVMASYDNLLFLRGYSEGLPDAIYSCGDLFLMPSSFEPCGISQMLAMRAGQPCLVHHVGGLVDTVTDGYNGFAFNGPNTEAKQDGLIQRFADALQLFRSDAEKWQQLCEQAASTRFLWSTIAREYVEKLYR